MARTGALVSAAQNDTKGSGVRLPSEVLLAVLAGNILLAVAAQSSPLISTAWAFSTLAVGVIVLTRKNALNNMVVVAAYVVGAELIWRATQAKVFWEYGKYVLIVLFGLALVRSLRGRLEWRAILFAVCLMPSLAVLPYFDRQEIAFNLSGPIALGMAIAVLSKVAIDRVLLVRISLAGLGPIVGLAFLATFGTIQADRNELHLWGKASTAGFGPNQVSSILGLGILLVFVLFFVGPRNRLSRFTFGFLGVWLTAQAMLSFARGGLWTAAGAILVAAFFVARDRRERGLLLVAAVAGFVMLRFFVIPATDELTGGGVSQRFSSFDLTGREKIMKADWIVFLENPLFGVGPGQSYGAHAITFRASSAHTEYTRLLAEHGSFGVVAMLMLAWISWRRVRKKQTTEEKGLSLALTAWALLYMAHSAMRLAAPAFVFGLGGATFVLGPLNLLSWNGVRRMVGGGR